MAYLSRRFFASLASNFNFTEKSKTVSHPNLTRALLVLLLCAVCAAGTFAQAPTASIVGTVLDPQGLPVEGANVALTNVGTNYTYETTTSSTGAFRFERLDAAVYRVTVTTANFRASVV